MQLVEQEPLWGRFGYSDLKGAALRSRSYVFSIGLRRVVRIAGLVLWTVWVGRERGLCRNRWSWSSCGCCLSWFCWWHRLDETQRGCACRSRWRDRGWSCRLMRHI